MRASSWGLLFMRVRHGGLGRILGFLGQTLEPCPAYYGGPGLGFSVGLGPGFAVFGVGPPGTPLGFCVSTSAVLWSENADLGACE